MMGVMGITWTIYGSFAPHSRQMVVCQYLTIQVFLQENALPAAQPTASKHGRRQHTYKITKQLLKM